MLALKFQLELAVEDEEPERFIKFIDGTIYLYTSGDRKVKASTRSVCQVAEANALATTT
ncbi:hypothetical protein [Variovorax sp. MHTC-1]|uniref:hypothetical protein n=1 Tax=Variovorax sp. MHTC-1 TaxID=2495593 RepID=UPI00163B752E|nr:hypothetical protein [Variovorax sp. MHTC-1]